MKDPESVQHKQVPNRAFDTIFKSTPGPNNILSERNDLKNIKSLETTEYQQNMDNHTLEDKTWSISDRYTENNQNGIDLPNMYECLKKSPNNDIVQNQATSLPSNSQNPIVLICM